MPAYNRDIPNGPNNPSADQPLMKTNFNTIDTVFQVDHLAFTSTNFGFHKKSTYPAGIYSLGSPPPSSPDQAVIFSSNTTPGTVLAYTRDGSGQSVALTTAKVLGPLASANGYSWFPGEVLFQWGVVTGPGSDTGSVTFPVAFPNNVYNVTFGMKLAGATSAHNVWISFTGGTPNLTKTGFSWKSDTSPTGDAGFFWQAIGN